MIESPKGDEARSPDLGGVYYVYFRLLWDKRCRGES